MFGTDETLNKTSIVFQIHKCSNETNVENGTCASEEEIDEYVKRIQVNTWMNYYKHDFNIHGGMPAKRVQTFMN